MIMSSSSSSSGKTIFVGDLSFFCKEIDLMHLFNTVGKVSSVEIKRGPNGESLLHAFIKFESEISAQLAVQGIHGIKFMGRRIVVNGTNTKAQKKDYNNWVKLTIHFTTSMDVDVSEEFLEHLCSPFGDIGDTIIRSHNRQQVPSLSIHGYGVVFYYDATCALRAMEALQGKVFNNIHLRTSLTPKVNGEYVRNSASAHVTAAATGLSNVNFGGLGFPSGGLGQPSRSLNSPSVARPLVGGGLGLGGGGLGLSINTGSSSTGFVNFGNNSNVIGSDRLVPDFSNPSYADVGRDTILGELGGLGLGASAPGGSQANTPRAGLSSLLPPNHPGLSLSISTNTNNANTGGIGGLTLGDTSSVLLSSAAPSDRSIIANIYEPYQSNPSSRTTTPRNATGTYSYQEANARLAAAVSLAAANSSSTSNYGGSSSFLSSLNQGFGSSNISNSGTPVARYGAEPFSSQSNITVGGISSSSPSVPLSINANSGLSGHSLLSSNEFSLTDDRADLLFSQQSRLSAIPLSSQPQQHSNGYGLSSNKPSSITASSNILSRNPSLMSDSLGFGGASDGFDLLGSANLSTAAPIPPPAGGAGTASNAAEMEQYFMYINRQRTVHNTAMHHPHRSPSSSRGSSPRNLHLLQQQQNQLQAQQQQQQQQQILQYLQLQQQLHQDNRSSIAMNHHLHHNSTSSHLNPGSTSSHTGNSGLPPLNPSLSASSSSFGVPLAPPPSTVGSSASSAASSPHSHASYVRQQQQQAWLQQQFQHLQSNNNSNSSANTQPLFPPTASSSSSPSLNRAIAPPALSSAEFAPNNF